VGTELVTTSVTSHNPYGSQLRFLLGNNPHFAFYDPAHGYTRHEITPDLWNADYLALDSVETPDAGISTIASFAIENGTPGAQRG
jgi:alkaline phosphatase D